MVRRSLCEILKHFSRSGHNTPDKHLADVSFVLYMCIFVNTTYDFPERRPSGFSFVGAYNYAYNMLRNCPQIRKGNIMNIILEYSQCSKIKVCIVITMILYCFVLLPNPICADEKKDTETISHFQKGEEFFLKGLHKEAIEEFKQALAKNPADFQTNKKLGLSYLNAGETDLGIAQLTAALLIEPNDSETLMALGNAYSTNKQLDKSIQEYKEILNLEPDNNEVRIRLGEVYAWQAREEEKSVLFDKAIMELEHVIHDEPKNALACKKLGWVYLEKKEFKKANNTLETAFNLNPEDHETKMLLAQACGYRGKYDEAIKIYNDIVAENSYDIDALYRLGEVLSWAKRYDESMGSYEKIIILEPTNLGAKFGIARVYALKGDYPKARAIYHQILDEDPKNMGALSGLAEMEQWQWHWNASSDRYKEILKSYPANRAAKKGLERIDFLTSPSLQANSGYFEDSDNFKRTWGGGDFRFGPFEKTSLSVGFVRWQFEQESLPTIHRNDYSFKIRQHINNYLDVEIGYTANDYSNGGTESSILSSAILNLKERGKVHLLYIYNTPIVDSISTISDDFSTNIYGAGIDYHFFEKWSFQGGFTFSDYSDKNKRVSRDAQLSYRLLVAPRLDLRFKYAFLDYDKQTSLYWTPTNYETYSFIANLEHDVLEKLRLGIEGTGTYFSKDTSWGGGVKGYMNLALNNSLIFNLSASYSDAKTEDPWLGKACELKVTYVF